MVNIMIAFKKEFSDIYAATNAQDVAKGAMAASRYELASSLWQQAVDLQNAVDVAKIKQKIIDRFPKGTGKDALEDERKAVSNIRQVLSVYKKAKVMNESPNNHPTYAAWREAIYGKPDTDKIAIIKGWIDSNDIKLTAADVQVLLNTYKAVGQVEE